MYRIKLSANMYNLKYYILLHINYLTEITKILCHLSIQNSQLNSLTNKNCFNL